jgi:hypothetical protein
LHQETGEPAGHRADDQSYEQSANGHGSPHHLLSGNHTIAAPL